MAITRVQHAIAAGFSSSGSCSYGGSTSAGNLLVACLGADNAPSTVPAGWTLAASLVSSAAPDAYIYYSENASSIAGLAFGFSSSNRWLLQIDEYSGIATSGALNASGVSAPDTGSYTAPTINTTNANCVIIYMYTGDTGGGTWSAPTNSFSIVDQINSGPGATLCVCDRVVSSTSAYSMSITSSVGPGMSIAGAAFSDSGLVTAVYQRPLVVRAAINPNMNW